MGVVACPAKPDPASLNLNAPAGLGRAYRRRVIGRTRAGCTLICLAFAAVAPLMPKPRKPFRTQSIPTTTRITPAQEAARIFAHNLIQACRRGSPANFAILVTPICVEADRSFDRFDHSHAALADRQE